MKVKFTDGFFAEEQTKIILKELFGEVCVSEDPDFLFCSVGYEANRFKYKCPRIFLTGENAVPDFNCVDYAIGFHYIDFEDRYKRVPLYCFYEEDYNKALNKHLNYLSKDKNKFCNFVYSNNRDAMEERDKFFHLLSEYKMVDSGGRHLNNIGGPVEDKYSFQKQYKFSIAFENASSSGYTTEKILQAFSAGTIPIYYGNPRISEEFNPKAFINCHDYKNFEAVIERIKEIDNDDYLYEEIIKEPIFTDMENKKDPLVEYEEFLKKICSQNPNKAIRRSNDAWGAKTQNEMQLFYRFIKKSEGSSLRSKVVRFLVNH